MTLHLRPLSTAALILALTGPAYAQETQTQETETQEATPAEDGSTASDFDMGTPIDENGEAEPTEPQPGQQYISEVFNDWALRCLKVEEGTDPCQMYQLLNDADGNNVAEVAIVPLANQGEAVAGATIVVPLETLLTAQLTLRVDGGQARRFPFTFCNQGGCVTRIGLTAQDIGLFKGGAAATLTLVPAAAPDQEVVATMSLSGFTAAYDRVVEE